MQIEILVDPEDEHYLTEFSWQAVAGGAGSKDPERRIDYAMSGRLYLHRLIMDAPPGVEVDHENGNGLDNRRSNLRLATRSQNMANIRPRPGCSSRFKGVGWHKDTGKWQAYIRVNYRQHSLGLFAVEEDAARAYDKAAREAWGEFARCNFEVAV